MTQIERHQVDGVIITITPTRFTYLVTVEHSCTGQIIDHLTRAWATEAEARAMVDNAKLFYSLTLAA